MENLILKQRFKVKKSIVDANNRLNSIFNSFDPFNPEFSPDNRLVDLFSNHFLFFHSDRKSVNSRKLHLRKLDEVVFNALIDHKSAIIISDVSIKNNIMTLIA